MRWRTAFLLLSFLASSAAGQFVEIPAETLRDKVRGGMLGQILGNLNGLPYENDFIDEPGNVTGYTPALPNGAWSDDDTDFEWVYLVAMQKEDRILLPPGRIASLWRERINRRIWCSNRFARHLMDLGLEPPDTGRAALNPWAEFNISGQFLSETFGLMAPAMPQTAARIGLNYTRVAIDLEPAQTTQFFTAMIATAFIEDDVDRILDAGAAALDPKSRVRQITADVRDWHRQHPDNWRTTRRLIKEKYTQAGGGMRDRNGFELNTASAVAALLYGDGDFAKTLLAAFNFGWDCDNTAATAGTIIGTVKGYRWMMSQGWQIVDRYENRTRENMPMDETITSFADRVLDLAERVIAEHGGERLIKGGQPIYRIRTEQPASIVALPSQRQQLAQMRAERTAEIESGVTSADPRTRARAAYLAIALDLWQPIQTRHPDQWRHAVDSLSSHWKIMQNIFHQPDTPLGIPLR
ncbi:MAG: ADP-ribosylglycohydrolase family protein, partial [bacterium]|nr:ADP-ribosylglycohydrolase family protein [bacterium]